MTASPHTAHRRAFALLSSLTMVILLLAPDATAFRPTTRWILDQAAARQLKREVRTLKVTQETTLFGLPTAPRGLSVQKRTWLLAPLSLREEVELPEGAEVRVHTPQKALIIQPGKKPIIRRAEPDLVADFLAGGAPLDRRELGEQMFKDLRRLKIDTDVVSYARFDGKVTYLIGSKPWEEDKSQLWIDKDSMQLVRIVLVEKSGDKLVKSETRLSGYGSPEGGSWFPKSIEEWRDGTLVRRSMTRAVEKNESLDGSLFEIR